LQPSQASPIPSPSVSVWSALATSDSYRSITKIVSVIVFLPGVGVQRAIVAEKADAVTIAVVLVIIAYSGTIIAGITVKVAVGIKLIVVIDINTVIAALPNVSVSLLV